MWDMSDGWQDCETELKTREFVLAVEESGDGDDDVGPSPPPKGGRRRSTGPPGRCEVGLKCASDGDAQSKSSKIQENPNGPTTYVEHRNAGLWTSG